MAEVHKPRHYANWQRPKQKGPRSLYHAWGNSTTSASGKKLFLVPLTTTEHTGLWIPWSKMEADWQPNASALTAHASTCLAHVSTARSQARHERTTETTLGLWQDKYFHFQPPQCFSGVVRCSPWINSSGWIAQQRILICVRVNITVQTRVLPLAVNTRNIINAVLEIKTGSPAPKKKNHLRLGKSILK